MLSARWALMVSSACLCLVGSCFQLGAQTTNVRIQQPLAAAARAALPGSKPPRARSTDDVGDLSGSTRLERMSLVFARTDTQEAALQALLKAQQNPASPLFHAWLTPEQFAVQFGVSAADLATTQAWLESQGFAVLGVNRSHDRISFSGEASQAERAFGVALHSFRSDGETHFGPASEVTLPAPLAAVTRQVTGLSSFRPRAHIRRQGKVVAPTPSFTSSQSSGAHYLTPGDVKTIYDITPAYTAGYTGNGQTIAVVGQSAIVVSDVEKFQSAAGLTVKDPTLVLVPNSGNSTVYSDDESESDLDVEYAGSVATGATVKFVYVGSDQNASVVDAEAYAVDNDLAQIVSISYGECELELGAADYATENAIFEQAAAQGQTVIAASGDDGSSDCAENKMSGLAVDFPASSQYVTGVGGTEFPSSDVASTNTTYWQATSGSDVISSALSYIPEQVWNDSTTSGLSSGGGGVSVLTARPTWQAGVTGIASGTYRLVPDISFTASPENGGFLYCSSDTTTEITGSCSNGFRDSSNVYLTVAGGTSFDAPIFAGMVALLNQAKGATTGQGLLNATLYSLASDSAVYAAAFHDVTSGTNECPTGYLYCAATGAENYAAGTGYDEASGLGSVDFYKLLTAWTATGSTSTLVSSAVTLSPATTTPAAGASDEIGISVASGATSSTTTPTGTVTVVVDGATGTTSLALSNGEGSYTFSSGTTGTHTVTVTYSGDSIYAASTATVTLTIPSTTTASSSFTLSATDVSVTAGSSATSAVTVTPAGGYTGTVDWTVTSSSTLANACYAINDTAISSTSAATATLTVYTSASACTSETPLTQRNGRHALTRAAAVQSKSSKGDPDGDRGQEFSLAAVLLFGIAGLRSRRLRPLALVLVMASAGLGLSGCGGGVQTVSTNATAGTYTLTLIGTDSASAALTATTTLTLTVR